MTGVPRFLRGRAELGLAALVCTAGIVVVLRTAGMTPPATVNVIGPKVFPFAVGALLVLLGCWLAGEVLRGGSGEPEGSEDVDVSLRSDWRTVALVTVAFGAHVALLRPAGWPIAAAVLFWGVAVALGARRWLRVAAIAIVLSGLTYFVFSRLLGVTLPAGVLQGVV